MTAIELLDDVKGRFIMLLHNEESALLSLLRKALMFYQDSAGFVSRHRFDESDLCNGNVLPLPADFLALITVKDTYSQYVSATAWDATSELEIQYIDGVEFPVTMVYMVNVLNVDLNEFEIPANTYSLIADYLELLISIPNNERLRRVSAAGKLDVSDIPSTTDLLARRTELEQMIALNRAIIPMVGIAG